MIIFADTTIKYILFFSLTLVGDFGIGDFPAFYLVWFFLLLYRRFRVSSIELLCQIFMMTALLPAIPGLIYDANQALGIAYYHSIFFIVLYVNALPLLSDIFKNPQGKLLCYISTFLFLIATLMQFSSEFDRTSVIFGPNILYRLYGLIFLYLFILKARFPQKISIFEFSIFTLAIIFLLVSTGSRGALLIIVTVLICYTYYLKRYASAVVFTFFVGVFSLGCVYLWSAVSEKYWRIIYFSLDNESIANRVEFIRGALDFLNINSFWSLFFGVGNRNTVSNGYPHNFIVETLIHNGIYLLLIYFLLFFVGMAFSKRYFPRAGFFYLFFIPVLTGSMVSGRYLDNYSFIAAYMFLGMLPLSYYFQEIFRSKRMRFSRLVFSSADE